MINVALPKGRLGERAYEAFASAGYDCPAILEKNRSIELAPILGLSDVIVDIVETGKTLLENHLAPLETIVDISAWLISSRVSYQFKHQEIAAMQAALARKL